MFDPVGRTLIVTEVVRPFGSLQETQVSILVVRGEAMPCVGY